MFRCRKLNQFVIIPPNHVFFFQSNWLLLKKKTKTKKKKKLKLVNHYVHDLGVTALKEPNGRSIKGKENISNVCELPNFVHVIGTEHIHEHQYNWGQKQ